MNAPADVLIVDVDNTVLPYMSSFLQPALTAGAARIAELFDMTVEELVRLLAPTMQKHGHDNPWLLELSPLRSKFPGGTEQQFIDLVVRPFWAAWDEAAETSGHAYTGVAKTMTQIIDRGKLIFALSNGRDFCVIQRLKAAGLLSHFEAVAAIRVRNTGGFDATVYNERRARILAANPNVELIILEEVASKPNSAGLLTILQRAGVDAEDCVFAGDARDLDGVAAAHIGMPYVWMAHGGVFVTHDFDAGYGEAPLQKVPPRFRNSLPVMHTAYQFCDLLNYF